MRAPSEPTLRRLAWAVWWFMATMVALAVPLSFVDPTTAEAWGGGGLVGEIGDLLFLAVQLAFPVTGLLILRRQPRNTIGWLLLAVGFAWSLSLFAENYVTYGVLVNPGSLPATELVAALGAGSWVLPTGLMGTFLILLYPDGRLPSPRWRPLAWLSAAAIVAVAVLFDLSPGRLEDSPLPELRNPLAVESAEPVATLWAIALTLFLLCVLASALALVVKYRRSAGVQRLQLKWLAAAAAFVAGVALITVLSSMIVGYWGTNFTEAPPAWVGVLQTAELLSFILIPIAIGTAILRHRLYDIDLIINRTLVYGALTLALAATYLGLVLLLRLVLSPLTGQSDLAVAGSTLAVAALFRPARARIQSAVDRAFYRTRYDAERTLQAFSSRLRSELDLDSVVADLQTVVRDTVQPAHVSVWLPAERGRA